MPIWLAFQRAVNVGQRKYPMAELRALLAEAGFDEVATHIQTGNIRLASPLRSAANLEAELERLFVDDRGFEVPTIVYSRTEFAQIAADSRDIEAEHGTPGHGQYVELLRVEPGAEQIEQIERIEQQADGQRAIVRGRAIHMLYDVDFHRAKAPTAAQKRAIGVSTNRNVKVVRALAEKWC